MYKENQIIRIVGEPKGSINEFARVMAIYHGTNIWISNLNMPFSGTVSCVVTADKIVPR